MDIEIGDETFTKKTKHYRGNWHTGIPGVVGADSFIAMIYERIALIKGSPDAAGGSMLLIHCDWKCECSYLRALTWTRSSAPDQFLKRDRMAAHRGHHNDARTIWDRP